jgi:hypothetical protein
LLSKQAQARGWWKVDAVAQLIAAHQSGRGRDFGALLWRLLFLDAWARQYGDTNSFLQGYAIEKDLQSKYEPRLA